jgi:Isopropylmalate/homocitrate/citramalate synthases
MKKNREISLLDTTLRDGSYTIGYQFSLLDNMVICSGLEKAGVKHIEIGHGTGLGTYRIDNNSQAYSDKEYMLSASKSLSDAEFGFFFIPGIGNSDDISMLSDHDGDFIRIGTSIEGFKEAKKFIKLAKKLNINSG